MKNNENKLIAEFMGEINSIEDKISFTKNCSTDELKYHTSWDWLMPVVEKIDKKLDDTTLFIIEQNRAFIEDMENYHISIDEKGNSRIEAIYKAVIKFIKTEKLKK